MTDAQRDALTDLCARYRVPFIEEAWSPAGFDLPNGYVAGWVGEGKFGAVYVGVSPEGVVSS